MDAQKIEPSKITKPIQLLAAWLAGLVLINGSFLTAASVIQNPEWAGAALVVASIANVPIFLICLFLLQTKFRPEMQEDEFYSRYLEKRYSLQTGKTEFIPISRADVETIPISRLSTRSGKEAEVFTSSSKHISTEKIYIAINDLLPSYRELVTSLLNEGIKATETFGSTSNDPRPPTQFVITIGDNVPMSLVQKILKISRSYGLEGVGRTPTNESPFHEGRIYIGSYAYGDNDPSRPILKLNQALLDELLSPHISEKAFWSLLPKS